MGTALPTGQRRIVDEQRFGDLVHDAERRVQRRHRVLEDHADLPTAHGAQLVAVQGQQVTPVQQDLAAHRAVRRRRKQAQCGEHGHRLAGSGLSHDAERFARMNVEVDTVHGADGSGPRVEVDHQVTDGQQWPTAHVVTAAR